MGLGGQPLQELAWAVPLGRGSGGGSPSRIVSGNVDGQLEELCRDHPGLAAALRGKAVGVRCLVAPPRPYQVLIVYDAACFRCSELARALFVEYGSLCHLVDGRDPQAVDASLHGRSSLRRQWTEVVRQGGLSAVFAGDVVLNFCEQNAEVLLWELERLRDVRFPSPEALLDFEGRCCLQLQSASAWREPIVLSRIGGALAEQGFVVLDGVLAATDYRRLRAAALRLQQRHMAPGIVHSHGSSDGFAGASEGLRQWTARGDYAVNVCEPDPREPDCSLLTRELDDLVTRLKDKSGALPRDVSSRLRAATFREDIMVACYPGSKRARYLRHTDSHRQASLTTMLYLNDGWRDEDGGKLRLYRPGSAQVRAEVMPVGNRLVLFWPDESNPHEVLNTTRDRLTMVVWYTNGAESFAAHGFAKLVPSRGERLNPVAPLSLAEALHLSGQDPRRAEQIIQMRALQVPVGLARPDDRKTCPECRRNSGASAEGPGGFADSWFRNQCGCMR